MRAPLQRLPTKALLDCICGAAYPPPACAYSHPLTALLRSISPGTFHGAVPISHRCASTAALGDYPAAQPRRVVVTGLGAVTPLGVGTIASWGALLQGRTGVRRLKPEDLPEVGTYNSVWVTRRITAVMLRRVLACQLGSAAAGAHEREAPAAGRLPGDRCFQCFHIRCYNTHVSTVMLLCCTRLRLCHRLLHAKTT